MDPFTARLVDFVLAFEYAHLSDDAVRAAKARVIDSIGVAMAAYLAPPVRIARRVAQPTAAAPGARLFGGTQRTTLEMAAFVNGSMVRYLDFNDAYRTLDACHPSDTLPGLLAVAEGFALDGRTFILGLAVAYEIQCRFTDSVPFNDAGWDQPVVGALACALATGRMLGLSREQLGHAAALAVIPNLCTYQTRAGELSMWKGCAGPNGARAGIFAALLARQGMSGPFDAFEGVFGVWNQTTGKPFPLRLPVLGEAVSFGLNQSNIKTYPVRDSCQLPIATALELRARLDVAAIESLTLDTYKSAHEGAVKDPELWRPKTRETADHSMPVAVAMALLDGQVSPRSFEGGRFLDADVLALIGRTTVDILDEFSAQTPQVRNCRITARLLGGGEVSAHRAVSLEDIERGISDRDLEEKFRACTGDTLDEARQQAFLAEAGRLDELERVDGLLDLLEL